MDLGLARSEDSQQSLTGNQSAMGTPGYMSPEQAMDAKSADKRSDVFSMGATLYALLCGHPPFKAETVMKVLMATMHEPHVPIIKVREDVSPALNDVLERCLAKKPDDRYSDAKELLVALQDCRRLLGDAPGTTAPSTRTVAHASAHTPAPGSRPGSKPGSTLERTMVGGGGTPVPESAPAPKKKGMLLVGAAAAVVVLGVGGVLLLKGGG